MRTTKPKTQKPRKEIPYKSDSFKGGNFKKDELLQYGLSDEEISVILDYQTFLPILQVENDNQKVNARDLHKQLKSKQQFADWIKNRIDVYQLIEGIDYSTASYFYETVKNEVPTKESIDYLLSIDCAKQLSMVERTDIGALVRRYFIIIEKAFINRINGIIFAKAAYERLYRNNANKSS